MKTQARQGYIPCEIGDLVKVQTKGGHLFTGIVEEILFIQSVRYSTSTFRLFFKSSQVNAVDLYHGDRVWVLKTHRQLAGEKIAMH